jgi:membrane-associated phospholipid phosphatase
MNALPRRRRPAQTRAAAAQLAASAAALGAMMLLARSLRDDDPPWIDRRARRLARTRQMRRARTLLSPLFALGLPVSYIAIAHLTARALHGRGARGGPAIVSSAWLGWLMHRAAKLVYTRERPHRRGRRRRTDSYPSGHTTGATALASTLAYVLQRGHLISRRRAIAVASLPAIVMGAYRVIDDEHWATDVIGGWLLGGAIALGSIAVLADSDGGTANQLKALAGSPRALSRRGRRESQMSATAADRDDFPGGRADTARPSVR